MKLVPLGDKIIIRPLDAEEACCDGQPGRGRIVLPESARPRPHQGRVLSVGDGARQADGSLAKPQVVEGDRVVFDPFAGTRVTIDGEEILILSEREILAVVP